MNTVLFDLDGTLLPLNQEDFVKEYFGALVKKFSYLGHGQREMVSAVWEATKAMVQNDGSRTNKEVFWDDFSRVLGVDMRKHESEFDSFYLNEFSEVSSTSLKNSLANDCVKELKRRGYTVVLATNPIFPAVATLERMRWAGLESEDFSYISTYENSCYSKPNPSYFTEILEKIGKKPSDCLMVGNDTREDGAAVIAGIPLFLLEGYILDHIGERDLSFARGGFKELYEFINALPSLL
jgi:haloacid dehalogenase superfamily, subfamily IA, variant 1 with third motif having Dx(3-4)D or Dx(3-4)E